MTVLAASAALAGCGSGPGDSQGEDLGGASQADTPPPGTPPPVSPGNGEIAGVPASGGGEVYYFRDALIGGFDWFDRLRGWFPSVLHTSYSVSPTHQVVDMAYAVQGTMTFKNVVVPQSGTYTLTFRYAFASGLFPGIRDRPEGIEVNGAVVTNDMHFPITGSFSVYQTSSIQVPLVAGKNSVVVFNVTDHGVSRIDTMTVK
jgi:hypothetical protein